MDGQHSENKLQNWYNRPSLEGGCNDGAAAHLVVSLGSSAAACSVLALGSECAHCSALVAWSASLSGAPD